jgi:hypothetical protein
MIVESEDYEDGYSDPDAADFEPRGLLTQRKPRFMVAVITGGSKPSVKTNRQAVIETWFDHRSFMVTLEEVPTPRVIRLSEFAESGGHRGLPRKVKHMFARIYETMIDDYDWFIKVRRSPAGFPPIYPHTPTTQPHTPSTHALLPSPLTPKPNRPAGG